MNRMQKLVLSCSLIIVVTGIALWLSEVGDQETKVTKTTHINSVFGSPGRKVFEPVLPDRKVELPKDFRFHPEFQHEWWQMVVKLKDDSGQAYWLRWRFFRYATDDRIATGWQDPQIYISNVVLNSHIGLFTDQRIARGGIGQAGGLNRPFRVWIDDWSWRSLSQQPLPGNFRLATDEFKINLNFNAIGAFAPIGEEGYHLKHDLLPRASYAVEAPFVLANGELELRNGKKFYVKGQAWLSKEWGSELVGINYVGEDNIIVWLSQTQALAISQYRYKDNLPYTSASLIDSDGTVTNIAADDIKFRALSYSEFQSGNRVPLVWSLQIPSQQIDVVIRAKHRDNWVNFVVPQWLGAIQTTGSHNANGFMQLSGY
ncbi:lipocalin-like domain-containing protein [Vibrio hangzhouensis]|uniref:Predicted secreted hydrolase n=1 Tax=Vibrio hangzhouensis TaxID=462991 RepID=A0A1H6C9B0_9VIBR|nr:lipocalin-like domain-containing protein [Vibrio hangzhouensis]SEG69337.1 Predicted secreted hydrolase [Vibrio hangzhouensis]